jgi:hypothetical protein
VRGFKGKQGLKSNIVELIAIYRSMKEREDPKVPNALGIAIESAQDRRLLGTRK